MVFIYFFAPLFFLSASYFLQTKIFKIDKKIIRILEEDKDSRIISVLYICLLWLSIWLDFVFTEKNFTLLLLFVLSIFDIKFKLKSCKKYEFGNSVKKFLISEWIVLICTIIILFLANLIIK